MLVVIGWTSLGPKLFPSWFPKPVKRPAQKAPSETAREQGEQAGSAQTKSPSEEGEREVSSEQESGQAKSESEEGGASEGSPEAESRSPTTTEQAETAGRTEQEKRERALPEHPVRVVTLGSDDPNSGYFLKVRLTSVGAAILDIELNDPRYTSLQKPRGAKKRPQLKVVGNHLTLFQVQPLRQPPVPLTLQAVVPGIDLQLQTLDPRASLNTVSWQVAETEVDAENPAILKGVTFRFVSPDGRYEVRKRFWLQKVTLERGREEDIRDATPEGYLVQFEWSIRNRGDEPATVRYVLLGPVGLPLENVENTRKYRDIKVGFREPDGTVDYAVVRSKEIATKDENQIEELKPAPRAFQFIGVDVQYFAALLLPSEEQLGTKHHSYIEYAKPVLIRKDPRYPARSDISVRLHSYPVTVEPGQEQVHRYALFAGPKRPELLRPLNAEAVMDFSTWLGIGYVGKGLLWLLKALHKVGIPYGVAILIMTVLVRAAMFPISRKQALSAKKMKDLQPQLQELRKKYANDKEKLARAQMELFAKHKYNPLSGCLPIVIQFPIFIGLYQALRMSVDLRLASFLWIDNLAAPDALFELPFRVPIVGWTEFNLLPILTVVLFLWQQKMFMPPPTDEQSEMQQKMMTYMMIFFGFLFYRLPSGLCLYFIASSLWGMGERKLLDYTSSNDTPTPSKAQSSPPKKKPRKPEAKTARKTPAWLKSLAERFNLEERLKQLDQQPAIQKSRDSRSRKKKPRTRPKR